MSRQTFFARQGPFTVGEIADLAGAEPGAGADRGLVIRDVAPFMASGPDDVTLIVDRVRLARADRMGAGACFIAPEHADRLPVGTIPLATPLPEAAFAKVIGAFYPDAIRGGTASGSTGAVTIDPTARLEDNIEIEAGAIIGPNVEIGEGTLVAANAVICADVKIGRGCVIGIGASIMHALIGNNVIIHPGARIGQDGFGYARGPAGFIKLPQIGRVIIQNDVEIGANATVDRGALEDTVIGEGTKIDNLVQIAHNAMIGRCCGFAAQSGVSGSVRIGSGVVVGGQAGTIPHITIGDGAQIAAGAGVSSDVAAGVSVAGRPHRPIDRFLREVRAVSRLARKEAKGAEG